MAASDPIRRDVSPADPPSLQLVASLSAKELYVKRNGETVATYAVAIGKPKYPTPRGYFNIRKVVWNPGWVPPRAPWARGKKPRDPGHPANPMKAVKIFFREPDYYIHGTGETETLGTAASHGCLRMSPEEATEVARLVMEHSGATRDEGWFSEVLAMGRTKTVRLPTPILLSIVP